MRRYCLLILRFITAGVFLTLWACNNLESSSTKWYEDTKAEILRQSELQPDSITFTFNEDSSYKREHHFFEGREFLLRCYNKEVLVLETHYSQDRNFELRREICENGTFGFEGIVYKDHFYGLSTWWHCNGQIENQGMRYKGEMIGIWKTWDERGGLTEEVDHKNLERLDSMPLITR